MLMLSQFFSYQIIFNLYAILIMFIFLLCTVVSTDAPQEVTRPIDQDTCPDALLACQVLQVGIMCSNVSLLKYSNVIVVMVM